jgi:hypothetical protein
MEPYIIKYRVDVSEPIIIDKTILEVKADKATERSVWLNGKQRINGAKGIYFFDTKKEALEFLIEKQKDAYQFLNRQMKQAKVNLEQLRAMKRII